MKPERMSKFCHYCKRQTMHAREEAKGAGCAPALLILCTCGLAAPLVLAAQWGDSRRPYLCQTCGQKN